MRFKQAIVSDNIQFFKKGFMDRWDFKDYYDPEKPAVFFGLYGLYEKYENHKGYKIYLPSTPGECMLLKSLKNHEKTILLWGDTEIHKEIKFLKHTSDIVELKDYKIFKPNIMGDKIYYYTGFKNGWSGHWGEDIIREIQKNVDFELITTEHNHINEYFDIDFLKKNYYDKSFLNLNLSKENGMTTVIEMGLMGRKTITMRENNPYKYESIINCVDIEDIIRQINIESKKINTIQEKIDIHTLGDEWLNLDFWLN
jgi:hypothetical protein